MLTTPPPDCARAELTGTRRSPEQKARTMETIDLHIHIGNIVHPAGHAAHRLTPPSGPIITGGVILRLNHREHLAAVRWIDYRGPQDQHRIVDIDDLLIPAPKPAPWWRRGTQHRPCTGRPQLRIRNLKVSRHAIETYDLDLWFHTVEDANAALRLIAAAKEPFHPRIRKDRRSNLPGALTVTTRWPSHTDVYQVYQPLRVA
ncbi:hypothetical protein ACFP2H_28070 [Mycolicibacterium llatzerense]|uniref:hypothetical protein n=1 Tax=Mycolicibacterium llatzerense TaxID=280871 RepID=UPI00360E9ACC